MVDAAARAPLDGFGKIAQRQCAEMPRFTLQRMRGKDERSGIAVAHRMLDPVDGFHAILANIDEDAKEGHATLGAREPAKHRIHDLLLTLARHPITPPTPHTTNP